MHSPRTFITGGVITFKGQMLLKGISDDVKISIVEDKSADEEAKTEKVETGEAPTESQSVTTSDEKPSEPNGSQPPASTKKELEHKATKSVTDEYEATLKRQSPQRFKFDSFRGTPTNSPVISRRKSGSTGSANKKDAVIDSSPVRTPFSIRQSSSNNVSLSPFRPSPQRSSPYRASPIVSKRKQDIAGSSSDGEAEMFIRQYQPPPPIGTCSDSEADGRTSTKRGRVTLPPVFLAKHLSMSSAGDSTGRPPAPWRMRKAKSSMNVTKSPDISCSSRRKSVGSAPAKPLARKKEPMAVENDGESNVDVSPKAVAPKLAVDTTPLGDTSDAEVSRAPDSPPNTKENEGPVSSRVARAAPVKQKSLRLSREASMRVDTEVHQLVNDIRRVGSNPGEPSVTFGELFDDETVQDTYEALVGTLRSAKRQGYIDFKGQMLFKGMHDDVTINVVEQNRSETVS